MAKPKLNRGLGKGLGALIPDIDDKISKPVKKVDSDQDTIPRLEHLDPHKVFRNPYQPRQEFDEEALQELKSSISEHGVIQPITVRLAPQGYELISGERRLRASKDLGLEKIPAYVTEVVSDSKMLEIALIENLQRDDLNPVETAFGFKRLMDEFDLTQEQVSVKVGKSRSAVTNYIRLLKLPEKVLLSVRTGAISMGHARALLSLEMPELIEKAFKKVVDKDLNVRETEKLVKDFDSESKTKAVSEIVINPEVKELENKLRHHYGTEVKVKSKNNKSGKIEIEFYSEDDFDRILEMLLDA